MVDVHGYDIAVSSIYKTRLVGSILGRSKFTDMLQFQREYL